MGYLPRSAILALVTGVATAGNSLPFENAPRTPPPTNPSLEALLTSTITVVSIVACCCCILPLCRTLRYRTAPDISDRGTDQANQQQSFARLIGNQALTILVDSPSPRSSSGTLGDPNESDSPTTSPRNLNSNSPRVESSAGRSI